MCAIFKSRLELYGDSYIISELRQENQKVTLKYVNQRIICKELGMYIERNSKKYIVV